MSGSRSAGQALNFFRRGILLLVNVLVSVLIIFMMFHACKMCYGICYEIYGPVVVEKARELIYGFQFQKMSQCTRWQKNYMMTD